MRGPGVDRVAAFAAASFGSERVTCPECGCVFEPPWRSGVRGMLEATTLAHQRFAYEQELKKLRAAAEPQAIKGRKGKPIRGDDALIQLKLLVRKMKGEG